MNINNPDYLVIIKQVPDPANPGVGGATVTAPLPEDMAYDTASEYAAPFAQGMLSSGGLAQAASALGIRVTTQAMTAQLWQGATESEVTLDLQFQTISDPDLDVRQPVLQLLKFSAASIDTATGLLKSPGPRFSLEDTGKLLTAAGKTLLNELGSIGNAAGSLINQFPNLKTDRPLSGPNANPNSNQQTNTPPATQNGLGGAAYWKGIVRNQITIQIGNYAYFDSVVILSAGETWSHQMDARTGLPLYAKVTIRFKPLFLVTQEDLDQIFARRR
jgi:hypothetical protein